MSSHAAGADALAALGLFPGGAGPVRRRPLCLGGWRAGGFDAHYHYMLDFRATLCGRPIRAEPPAAPSLAAATIARVMPAHLRLLSFAEPVTWLSSRSSLTQRRSPRGTAPSRTLPASTRSTMRTGRCSTWGYPARWPRPSSSIGKICRRSVRPSRCGPMLALGGGGTSTLSSQALGVAEASAAVGWP